MSKARGIERTEQGRRIPEVSTNPREAAARAEVAREIGAGVAATPDSARRQRATSAASAAPGSGAATGRRGELERTTRETRVKVALDLDGGASSIAVPNGFFGHLLDALARHGGLGLTVEAEGDVHVDVHHTVEDVGIVLGECLHAGVGDGRGIARYGSAYAPLDEALARAVVDVSGRGFLDLTMTDAMERSWVTPDFAMTLVRDFFQGFADRGRVTVHVDVIKGRNPHHVAEACFKALALALRQAVERRAGAAGAAADVPSTKGTIAL